MCEGRDTDLSVLCLMICRKAWIEISLVFSEDYTTPRASQTRWCISGRAKTRVKPVRPSPGPRHLSAHMWAQLLSRVRLFATPWTVARQVSLSMRFFQHEYWSGFPFPFPGDLPNPRIEPMSPVLAGGFVTRVYAPRFLSHHNKDLE